MLIAKLGTTTGNIKDMHELKDKEVSEFALPRIVCCMYAMDSSMGLRFSTRTKPKKFQRPGANVAAGSTSKVTIVTPPSTPKYSFRITGGSETTIERYPFMAQVFYGARFYCGGSLITTEHVLTAAHCILTRTVKGMSVRRRANPPGVGESPGYRKDRCRQNEKCRVYAIDTTVSLSTGTCHGVGTYYLLGIREFIIMIKSKVPRRQSPSSPKIQEDCCFVPQDQIVETVEGNFLSRFRREFPPLYTHRTGNFNTN
ncbi:CLIP domain-containing serine protease 2 [Eumeta japonica]|uniref:CLIP domain-containing serine protease 2 n=1 Tax=Eumeta variegata TaxID=151549 RepID=A0A4C1SE61_EUMVA|nr:CLIP domain-containing serine protease 2 [Eumeta japonica]